MEDFRSRVRTVRKLAQQLHRIAVRERVRVPLAVVVRLQLGEPVRGAIDQQIGGGYTAAKHGAFSGPPPG